MVITLSLELCDSIDDNNCDGVPGTQAETDQDCATQNGADCTCVSGSCVAPPATGSIAGLI